MGNLIKRNLKNRRAQVVSMTVSIAVCAMVFVALFLLYGGLQRGVALNEERGGADIMVVPSSTENFVSGNDYLFTGAPVMAYFSADKVAEIAKIDGVAAVTEQFYGQTLAESCCSAGVETRVIGYNPATDFVVQPYLDRKVDSLAPNEIVIGCKIDAFPSGSGKILGQEMTVVAQLEETGSALDYSILMDIDAVRALSASSSAFDHFWETYGSPDTIVSTAMVAVEDDANVNGVLRAIKKLGDVTVIQRSAVIADTQKTLDALFTVMLAAGIVLVVASLMQFVARYSSSVWERKSELALYRALGATSGNLKGLICGEAFAITGIGALIGVVLGIALYFGGYAYLQNLDAFPFSALPLWAAVLGVVAIVAVFFLVALISIIAPLRQVSRIDPASAMQQVDIG